MLPNLPNSSKFPHQSGLPAPCVKLQHLIRAFVRFKTVSWEFLSTDVLLNMSTIALAGRVMSERFSRAMLYNAVVVYQTLTQFSFESISKRQISEISETEAKLFPKPPYSPLKRPQSRPPIGKQSATTTKALAFRHRNARCKWRLKPYPLNCLPNNLCHVTNNVNERNGFLPP